MITVHSGGEPSLILDEDGTHAVVCLQPVNLSKLIDVTGTVAGIFFVHPHDAEKVTLRELRAGWTRVRRQLNMLPALQRVLLMCDTRLLREVVGKVPELGDTHGTLFSVDDLIVVPTWTLENAALRHVRPWMDRDVMRFHKLTRPLAPLHYHVAAPRSFPGTVVVDLETSGLDAAQDHITVLGIQWSDRDRAVLTGGQIPPVIEQLRRSPPTNLVFHNSAFDLSFLGADFRSAVYGHVRDTMLRARARGELVSSLKHLGAVYTAAPGCYAWGTTEYTDPAYVCEDIDTTWRLFKLWSDTTPVVEIMERAAVMTADQTCEGSAIDTTRLETLARDGAEYAAKLERELTVEYGVSPGQTEELTKVLIVRGYELSKKTKTGKDALTAEVLLEHGLLDILEYRKAVKLDSAFVGKIKNLIRPDGRLPHHQSLLAASTGRTTMSNYNHQQSGKKGPTKSLLVSRFPGGKIVNCDLKTAEVVVAAYLSGDANLAHALMSSDMHRDNAARGFDIVPEAVDDAQRFAAKALIFRSIFGGSPQNDVQKKVHRFMTREFRRLFQWIDAQKLEGQSRLRVTDPLGKVTCMLDKYDYAGKWACGRLGINAPVQGTSSHIAIWLTLRVWELLRAARMLSLCLFGVHDSFLVDAHPAEVDAVINVIRLAFRELNDSIFAAVFPMLKTLPMRGEIQVGASWADCKSAPIVLCSSLDEGDLF